MSIPYPLLFLALLLLYMVYSEWAGLDSRYPVAAALGLLVVTAVVDALGNVPAANTLAEYVFLLLAGGVVLLLVDHLRAGRKVVSEPAARSVAPDPPGEAAHERHGSADQVLHRPEQ